jgi:tRNA-2-methylthio-N6-dimethylallyladenosine synthase
LIGKTVEVMVEGQSKLLSRREPGAVELGWEKNSVSAVQLVGRTRGDQVVVFDGPMELKGTILNLRIVDAASMTLFGAMSNESRAPLRLQSQCQ